MTTSPRTGTRFGPPVQWLGIEQLAEELGVPIRTIYNWRTAGKGPRAARFGKHLRFRRSDVDAWVEDQLETPRGVAS